MKQSGIALLVVLLFAFALRLCQISAISLRADEASNLFFASQDLNAIVKQLASDDPHPPFYFFLLHFWVALAGNSELALRFLGVFSGTLIVGLSYLLGKILLPTQPRVALGTAALAAINPSLIWDAQDAHLYPWLVWFSVASCVMFLLVMQRGSFLRRTLYIFASALALYSHYIAVFVLVAQGVLVISVFRDRFLPWLAAQFAVGVLFVPWFLLAGNLLGAYQTDFFPRANFREILMRALAAFAVGRVDNRVMPPMVEQDRGLVAALFFLGIFLIGLWSLRSSRTPLAIALSFLFVPLICFWLYGIWRFSIFDERYVLYLAPAFLLVTARGLIALNQLPKGSIWLGTAALIVLAVSGQSLYNYWRVPAFAKSPDWRGFAQKILSEAQPGDVLIQNYPDPSLPYYLQNRIPRVLLPRSSGQSANDLGADLARLIAKYSRVWFQPAAGSTWDTEGLVAQWFSQNARKVADYEFNGARLELYLPLTNAGVKP